jgi:hypothetical protein
MTDSVKGNGRFICLCHAFISTLPLRLGGPAMQHEVRGTLFRRISNTSGLGTFFRVDNTAAVLSFVHIRT